MFKKDINIKLLIATFVFGLVAVVSYLGYYFFDSKREQEGLIETSSVYKEVSLPQENKIFLPTYSAIKTNEDKSVVEFVQSGSYYFDLKNNQSIMTDGASYVLTVSSETKLIFNPKDLQVLVVEGGLKVGDQEAGPNQKVNLKDSSVESFNRVEQFGYSANSKLLADLKDCNCLPDSLIDTTPPTLDGIDIRVTKTVQPTIGITGKTEKNAQLYINENLINLNSEGGFEFSADLALGSNEFRIKVEDIFGNYTEFTKTYFREKDPCENLSACGVCGNQACTVSQPVNPYTAATCDDDYYVRNTLNLINSYRKAAGKSELTLDEQISKVACSHSYWMSVNNNLSHIGEFNSHAWDRCGGFETVCTAENIGRATHPSSQKPTVIFDAWVESYSHNQTILGEYTKIGIALYGDYATTVFR